MDHPISSTKTSKLQAYYRRILDQRFTNPEDHVIAQEFFGMVRAELLRRTMPPTPTFIPASTQELLGQTTVGALRRKGAASGKA